MFGGLHREQTVYKMSAIAATLGIGSLAVAAIYYRFAMHMAASGGEFPLYEAAATLLLTMGGAVSPPSTIRAPHALPGARCHGACLMPTHRARCLHTRNCVKHWLDTCCSPGADSC